MSFPISRKQFLTLAIVTLGVGCGSDDSDEGGTGGAGAGGTGTGGSGTGGSSTGGTGTGGTATGGSGGTATGGSSGSGTGGTATGGAAGSTSNACTADLTAEIFDNHGHELHIPLADIEAGVEVTYETTGEANHCHTLTLTAADFATLKSGGSVTKTSCTGTNHQYVLGCVNPPAPAEPDCNGTPNLGACN